MAGFIFTRQASPGKWGVATYALKKTDSDQAHRGHRGHKIEKEKSAMSDAPYGPDAQRPGTRHGTEAPKPMPEEPAIELQPDTNEPRRFRARI
jgi:hypothetical protein